MAIILTFFLGNIGQKNGVLRYFSTKKRLSRLKRTSKPGKIEIFHNELTDGIGPKMAIFPISLGGNIGQENMFYDIVERKNAFLG